MRVRTRTLYSGNGAVVSSGNGLRPSGPDRWRMSWNGNLFAPPLYTSKLYLPGHPGVGSTITDFSGNGYDGSITGATWRKLPNGLPYLSFDGNDYVALPSALYQAFANTDDFTLCALFYADDVTPAGTEMVIGLVGDEDGGSEQRPGIHISLAAGGKVSATVRLTADNTQNQAESAAAIAAGWHFAALRHDASDTNAVYLDLDGLASVKTNTNALTFAKADFDEGNVGALGATTTAFAGLWHGGVALAIVIPAFLSKAQSDYLHEWARHLVGV